MEKRKVPEMKEVIIPIPTKVITVVTEACPISNEPHDDFDITWCQGCCAYLITLEGKPISHGWREYGTSNVRERSESDDQEDPTTDYYKIISCAGCGADVTFYSGYSNLVRGDEEKCPKCGLLHTFLRSERKKRGKETVYVEIFAIPIKEDSTKQKQ